MLALAGLALAAFAVQSVAWPLWPGRDAQTYLMYYLDFAAAEPVFPQLMLFRTPAAPLFFGVTLEVGGALLAEAAMGVLYVLAILATYLTGCFWARRAGLASAIVLLLYPGYGALFHNVSSDGLFAFGLAAYAAILCATAAAPTLARFALAGAALFSLVMVRPSALFLVPVALAVPLLHSAPWRERLSAAAVFLAATVAPLAGWAAYNEARYGDFTISRLSAAQSPLYRTMSVDRIVDPGNGPASRELASAIETDLLAQEPYRSYGVTLDEVLRTSRIRAWSDMAALSDRTWGWDSDYAKLRAVALEAIRTHLADYVRGVARTTGRQLLAVDYTPPAPQSPPAPRTIECELGCVGEGRERINGRLLPPPIDPSEPVPRGYAHWLDSTPDNSIQTDWSSFARPRFVFKDPTVRVRYERLSADLSRLMSKLPSRSGSATWTYWLNRANGWLPPMALWIALAVVGVGLLRPPNAGMLGVLACLGLALVVGTALGSPEGAEYRLPADPLFILAGVTAVMGAGAVRRPTALAGWFPRSVH